ncbi:unnamed protein product, partial [Symbiodinium sp. CCMP2456]
MENLGPPLPNPEEYNANVKLYADAIEQLAYDRGHHTLRFGDAVANYKPKTNSEPKHLTDNGMHLTEFGYWYVAPTMVSSLQSTSLQPPLKATSGDPLNALKTVAIPLPYAASPKGPAPKSIACQLPTLQEGSYTLKLSDASKVTASAEAWKKGVDIPAQDLYAKTEALRQTILRKNQLFFDRFRPQNETYLYLFRKHEQGNNAVEIPQFDPLIEAQDNKILELKQSVQISLPMFRSAFSLLLLFLAPAAVAFAQRDLKVIPDTDPAEELRSFTVADGFEVNLFASEPMIASPIQINFDAQGRLWVASSSVYPQIEPGQVADDKILMLEDTNGDGTADKS